MLKDENKVSLNKKIKLEFFLVSEQKNRAFRP